MESNGIFIPVFATFLIRDGKAARDMGNHAQMQRMVDKVNADNRLSDEQKFEAVWHIQNAKYTPMPTKPVSGCVSKGYGTRSKVYTAGYTVTPAEHALEVLKAAAEFLTADQIADYTIKVEAKFAAEEEAKVASIRKDRLDLLNAALAL